MSASDLDRRLSTFFTAASSEALPDGVLDDVYAVTRQMPQRKGLAARRTVDLAAWWTNPFGPAPQLRMVAIAVLLLIALAASLVYVAGHYRRLPPPYGPADNGVIVFDVDKRLYLREPDGTTTPLDIGLDRSWGPAFSPDGTRFAFWSQGADGTPIVLYVANADGTDARPIAGDVRFSGFQGISWSPDGTRIVYQSEHNGFHAALYVAAADGSGARRISPDDGADRLSPAWSPHGDLIVYRKDAAGLVQIELAVMSPDGGDERTLKQAQISSGGFKGSQWSPDGTRIAYFRMIGGSDVVEVMDLEGTVQRVSGDDEDAYNPVWSNDGRRIAYNLRTDETVIVDLPTGHAEASPYGSRGLRRLLVTRRPVHAGTGNKLHRSSSIPGGRSRGRHADLGRGRRRPKRHLAAPRALGTQASTGVSSNEGPSPALRRRAVAEDQVTDRGGVLPALERARLGDPGALADRDPAARLGLEVAGPRGVRRGRRHDDRAAVALHEAHDDRDRPAGPPARRLDPDDPPPGDEVVLHLPQGLRRRRGPAGASRRTPPPGPAARG